MTFNQFYAALVVIGIPLYLLLATRRDDWNWIVILVIFGLGVWILLWVGFVAWIFDNLKYLPSWLLFQETGGSGFRYVAASYGFIVASILLALRHLVKK